MTRRDRAIAQLLNPEGITTVPFYKLLNYNFHKILINSKYLSLTLTNTVYRDTTVYEEFGYMPGFVRIDKREFRILYKIGKFTFCKTFKY